MREAYYVYNTYVSDYATAHDTRVSPIVETQGKVKVRFEHNQIYELKKIITLMEYLPLNSKVTIPIDIEFDEKWFQANWGSLPYTGNSTYLTLTKASQECLNYEVSIKKGNTFQVVIGLDDFEVPEHLFQYV